MLREKLSFSNSSGKTTPNPTVDQIDFLIQFPCLIVWFCWMSDRIFRHNNRTSRNISFRVTERQIVDEPLRIRGEITTRFFWIDGFPQHWPHLFYLFFRYWMNAGDEAFPFFFSQLVGSSCRVYKIMFQIWCSLVQDLTTSWHITKVLNNFRNFLIFGYTHREDEHEH